MIILANQSGQLGNQLRSLSSFVALGIEHNKKIICPVVSEQIINNFKLDVTGHEMSFYNSGVWAFFSVIFRAFFKIYGRKNAKFYSNTKKPQIFTDWISFADPKLLYKHYNVIEKVFDFKEDLKTKCSNRLKEINPQGRQLIAVHFRRGDYKEWQGGKWYFSSADFLKQIKSLNQELSDALFLIFSNENVEEELFYEAGINNVVLMNGTAVEDLCSMSMADYIIGPPSTFSAWAGYIGNRKLVWMLEHNEVYKIEDFKNVPLSFKSGLDFWKLEKG